MSFNSKRLFFSSLGLAGLTGFMLYHKRKNLLKPSNIIKCLPCDPLMRSKKCEPMKNQNDFKVFAGSANQNLSEEIAKSLGIKLGKIQTNHFADGELNIQILDSIRGKEVYIIQSTCPPVNENLVELLLTVSAMKRTQAKKITAIIPYYGYGRADRKLNGRVPISAADVAKMLEVLGVDRVVSVDLHCGQIQGFFGPSVPVDNLEAQLLMVEHMLKNKMIKDYNKLFVISPDHGGVYRAKQFAELLREKTGGNVGLTMTVKQRERPNEVSKLQLIGNVKDNDCIIVDDMIDTGGTLCAAAKVLKENGARNIYAFATHGLLNGKAVDNINNSVIDKLFLTNSIPQKENKKSDKIEYISIGLLLAEAIRRIQNNESISEVFSAKV